MSDSKPVINNQSKGIRYSGLEGIKALACLLVIASHIGTNSNYDGNGALFYTIFTSLSIVVFLFMTISGFGMCCGYYDKVISNRVNIVDFYKKRYKKILPFFGFLCLIEFIMSPSLEALYDVFANLTLCFGLIPNADIKVIGVGWFLGTVFAFYFLFPFFCFLLADRRRAWLAFLASLIMNLLCVNYFGVDRKSIAYSFVYFFAGGMVYLYRDKVPHKKSTQLLLIVLMIAVLTFFYTTNRTMARIMGTNTITVVILHIIILLYGMGVSETHVLNAKPLRYLGGISFEVYLCHMFVFRFLEKLHLLRISSNDYLNYCIVYIAVLAGSIVFSVIGKRFIELVCSRISAYMH